MLADVDSMLAKIGPIGPGPMKLGPIGPGPLGFGPIGPGPVGFGPKIAGTFDEQRSREDEARQRADEARQRAEEEKQREAERRQRIDENYQRGQESLERRAWARAADSFTRVIDAQNSTRVDAALYWKAYALDKLNQQADALADGAGSDQALPAEPLDQRREGARAAGAPERRPGAAPRSRIG